MDVSEKLQLRPAQRVLIVNRPGDDTLAALPVAREPRDAQAFVGFARSRADLALLGDVVTAAQQDLLAWVAYPKDGQLGTDLSRDVLAAALRARKLRPVRQVAIDGTWSALRFRPA